MKIRIVLSFAAVFLALALSARAALVWQNPLADLHPALADKTAVAHFKFKNTGDKPITITGVHPSCGCTTAALPKNVIAPGESGEITATFNIGDRSGVQTKTIRVTTDDPQISEPTILKLTATIPKLLEVTPAFLYWKPTEELTPKTISVKVGDFPVTKLAVSSTDPAISAQVAPPPNEKEKNFQITVTPKEGNRPIGAVLKIEPDYPKDAPKTFYANVRVDRRPPAAPTPTKPPQ